MNQADDIFTDEETANLAKNYDTLAFKLKATEQALDAAVKHIGQMDAQIARIQSVRQQAELTRDAAQAEANRQVALRRELEAQIEKERDEYDFLIKAIEKALEDNASDFELTFPIVRRVADLKDDLARCRSGWQ